MQYDADFLHQRMSDRKGPKKGLSLVVPAECFYAIKRLAAERNTTMSNVVRSLTFDNLKNLT